MEIDIAWQTRSLLLCLALGLGGGLLYDLLRAVRIRWKKAAPLTHLLDGVFAAAVACTALYLCVVMGGGVLRLYMVSGMAVGAVIWFVLPGPYCRELWDFWVDVAISLLKLLFVPTSFLVRGVKKAALFVKKSFLFPDKYATIEKKLPIAIAVYRRRKGGRCRAADKKEKSAAFPPPFGHSGDSGAGGDRGRPDRQGVHGSGRG